MSAVSGRHHRVAAHTYSYRDHPLEVALERISGLGFSAVEIWIGHAPDGAGPVVKALAGSGLRAIAVGAGGFYDELASSASRSFELALAVGAEIVVACVVPRALPQLSRILPLGLTLCVENHWDQPMRRPRDIERLLARAPATLLGACLEGARLPRALGHAWTPGIRSLPASGPNALLQGLGRALRTSISRTRTARRLSTFCSGPVCDAACGRGRRRLSLEGAT